MTFSFLNNLVLLFSFVGVAPVGASAQSPNPLPAPGVLAVEQLEPTPALPVFATVIPWWQALTTRAAVKDSEFQTSEALVAWPTATSIKLEFSGVSLPKGAWLEVTSEVDAARQVFTAADLEDGKVGSAFFNGPAVRVRLYAESNGPQAVCTVNEVAVGVPAASGPNSICATDDRRSTSRRGIGRLLVRRGASWGGCTAFLVTRSSSGMVTAGHCMVGTNDAIVQFQVPNSTANGSIVNPDPQHQYRWISSTARFESNGSGADWAVFRCAGNPVTPYSRELVTYIPASPSTRPSEVRIAGYGVDSGAANQTMQWNGGGSTWSDTRLLYRIDTAVGNSGSPVYWTDYRFFAVHTHGGCTSNTAGYNKGTVTTYPSFLAALRALGY